MGWGIKGEEGENEGGERKLKKGDKKEGRGRKESKSEVKKRKRGEATLRRGRK